MRGLVEVKAGNSPYTLGQQDSVLLWAHNQWRPVSRLPVSTKTVLSEATIRVADALKTLGYTRSGTRFIRRGTEVLSLIELQTSRSSTNNELSFVVNFGVVVISLTEGSDLSKPTYTDCHWGSRVSGQDGVERWWTVRVEDSPAELAEMLESVLRREVLPALESKQTEEAMIALWQTGRSPLLVEAQRLLFLGLLLHKAGKCSELVAVRSELELKARDGFGSRALDKLKGLAC